MVDDTHKRPIGDAAGTHLDKWGREIREKLGDEVLEAYDRIPAEVIYGMNIAYLCGEMAGADLGDDGFTGWIVRAMKSSNDQINETLECFYAVAAVTGNEQYLPPDQKQGAASNAR